MTEFERFPVNELKTLREELMQAGLDSFHVGELLAGFLIQHGYGVSTVQARSVASAADIFGCSLLTWTVRTPEQRARAQRYADQMIFEGFVPEI